MENLIRYSPTTVVWTLAVGVLIIQLLVIHKLPPLQSKRLQPSVAKPIHLRIKPALKKVEPPVKKLHKPTQLPKKPKTIAQNRIEPTLAPKKNVVKVISQKKPRLSPKQKISSSVKVMPPIALSPVNPIEAKPKPIVQDRIKPKVIPNKKVVKVISQKEPRLSQKPKISSPVIVNQSLALSPVMPIGAKLQQPLNMPSHPLIKTIAKPKIPILHDEPNKASEIKVTRKPLEKRSPISKNLIDTNKVVQKSRDIIPTTLPVQRPRVEDIVQKQSEISATLLENTKKASLQFVDEVKPEDLHRLGTLIKRYIAGIDLLDYYPRRAIKRKLKGKVLIALSFDSKANLKEFHLKTTSGYKILDQAAYRILEEHEESLMASIQQHQFELPNKARISIPIRFALR